MSQYANKSTSKKIQTGWIIGCAAGGIIIMCLVGFIFVGGFAWLLSLGEGELEALSFEVSTSTDAIAVGDVFQVALTLTNSGIKDVTVSEIQMPNGLLENVQVIGVAPIGRIGIDDGIFTAYDFDLTIAPDESEMVVFSLMALNSVDVSGEVRVKAGSEVSSTLVRVIISPAAVVEPIPTPTQPVMMRSVIPYRAVVQIIAIIDLNGQLTQGWSGSGTIVSEDGLILTNAHVVLSDRFYDVADLVVSITMEQDQPPEPMFYADVIQADANLDLAVIKVRSDLNGGAVNFSALGIEPVRIGPADALQLGDPIIILGYPGIGGETITLTRGEVSGFTSEAPYGNRAFIKTSATIAGGNSGGLAANSDGEIIGIPTEVGSGELEGLIVDCRALADTNRDGVIDERDNCVPTGGFINALRPINLAQPLIEAALAGHVAINEDPVVEEPQEYEHEGDEVLYDDFSDNGNGWYLGEYTNGNVDIVDGELVISVDAESAYIFTYMPETFDSLIMATELNIHQPTGEGDFGFVCGYVDDQNYTVLEVSEDGYYAIWVLVDDQEVSIVDWTPSDMIPTSGPFTLAAYCGTDGFALAVNDTLLVDSDAPHYKAGRVGLFIGTWNQANLRVGFNEFLILEP